MSVGQFHHTFFLYIDGLEKKEIGFSCVVMRLLRGRQGIVQDPLTTSLSLGCAAGATASLAAAFLQSLSPTGCVRL